jgi:cytochrome c5
VLKCLSARVLGYSGARVLECTGAGVLKCASAGVLGCVGALVLTAQVLGAQGLPAGAGADVLKQRCVSCHESDIITSQKLSLAGWTRSVDKMVRWGSAITPAEREVLHPYLAANFGPRPAASHATANTGTAPALSAAEGTYKRACQTCHEADIIEQQKLSRTGWNRSVEKMMRWGATVSAEEKEPLIDYLAAKFGPR